MPSRHGYWISHRGSEILKRGNYPKKEKRRNIIDLIRAKKKVLNGFFLILVLV